MGDLKHAGDISTFNQEYGPVKVLKILKAAVHNLHDHQNGMERAVEYKFLEEIIKKNASDATKYNLLVLLIAGQIGRGKFGRRDELSKNDGIKHIQRYCEKAQYVPERGYASIYDEATEALKIYTAKTCFKRNKHKGKTLPKKIGLNGNLKCT